MKVQFTGTEDVSAARVALDLGGVSASPTDDEILDAVFQYLDCTRSSEDVEMTNEAEIVRAVRAEIALAKDIAKKLEG